MGAVREGGWAGAGRELGLGRDGKRIEMGWMEGEEEGELRWRWQGVWVGGQAYDWVGGREGGREGKEGGREAAERRR